MIGNQRKIAGTFPTAGDYGQCQKSTFYTLKAPIRKMNIFLHLKNQNNHNTQISKPCATTTATIMSSRRIALSRYTALLTAAFGVDKKMLPENPLKHEMKLLKFEHNKLKNTQVDDKTYYNIIHLKT